MRLLVILIVCSIAACNTATPGFRDITAQHVEIGETRFLLRQAGALVEVTRTNPTILPRFETTSALARTAVHRATGCDANWIIGDTAVMIIGLSCDGAPPPPKPKRKVSTFCDVIDSYKRRPAGLLELTVDCYLR